MTKLSLNVMTKNAASTIEATLESAWPHFEELVLVDNDSSDGTVEVVRRWCGRRDDVPCTVVPLTATTHPELHRLDVQESYRPIADAPLPGPFTGKQILVNFAGARNLALAQSRSKFILTLDHDDVVLNPEEISADLDLAQRYNLDRVDGHYTVAGDLGTSARATVVRRRGAMWHHRNHETIRLAWQRAGKGRMRILDTRACSGDGVRIQNRHYKIGHLAVQDLGIEGVSLHDLSTWVQEALTPGAVDLFLGRRPPPDLLAFTLADVADKICDGQPDRARSLYARAWEAEQGPAIAHAMRRLEAKAGRWSEAARWTDLLGTSTADSPYELTETDRLGFNDETSSPTAQGFAT